MEKWRPIFVSNEKISIEIVEKLEEMIQPYLQKMQKATIYKTKEKKEVLSDQRDGWKTIIESSEIHDFLHQQIIPYIQKIDSDYEFEILPSHFDYMEYEKGGHFDKHIDFVSNHTNFTKQYTCIIGLETCLTGNTFIWDYQEQNYIPYSQSIIRGGLLIFESELSHFAETFKDEKGKKRIFSFSLRGMKRTPPEKKYQFITQEGNIHSIEKSKMKGSYCEVIDLQKDEDTIIHLPFTITDYEIQLIFHYIDKKDLSIHEMEQICQKLAFFMLIQPDYMDHSIPSWAK